MDKISTNPSRLYFLLRHICVYWIFGNISFQRPDAILGNQQHTILSCFYVVFILVLGGVSDSSANFWKFIFKNSFVWYIWGWEFIFSIRLFITSNRREEHLWKYKKKMANSSRECILTTVFLGSIEASAEFCYSVVWWSGRWVIL